MKAVSIDIAITHALGVDDMPIKIAPTVELRPETKRFALREALRTFR